MREPTGRFDVELAPAGPGTSAVPSAQHAVDEERNQDGREGELHVGNARTAGFTVLVFAQLFNCFNARSETTSAFRHLFVNPWLWGAIALSVDTLSFAARWTGLRMTTGSR